MFLDCTRLDGSKNLVSRLNLNDLSSVEKQIKLISRELKSRNKNMIVLADDVVFSGSVLRTIIGLFKKNCIEVVGVSSVVSTRKAYDYFNKELLLGIYSGYVLEDDVIDQICERDFYFGIAQSGISIKMGEQVYKAPYFKPFGNPVERASIPSEAEASFSNGCIDRSILLWEEISKLSGRDILIRELPKVVNCTERNLSVVKTLKKGRL